MWTRHRKQSRFRHMIVPSIAVSAMAYFVYHAYEGNYGLRAAETYEARIAELRLESDRLAAEVARLEQKTNLLRDGTIEQDMLDEQARRMLGYSRESEIIIRLQ